MPPVTAARRAALGTPRGSIALPAFLPDATHGVVRAVDSADLEQCGIQALVMNVFHLMQRPGSSTIRALGGLHALSGWRQPILTDSGGFQAYSLIRQNPRYGHLGEKGITFRPDSGGKLLLTPEKSIQLQIGYGADIVVCLDDCTHPDDPIETQHESVERTITWARRCRAEFDRLVDQKGVTADQRPLLVAVIQGGGSFELRKRCAGELLGIGFDGFGYGGWPLDSAGALVADVLAYTRQAVPPEFPMHALGVGHPASIAACVEMGYDLFDSALPTRDARHGRLYAAGNDGSPVSFVYVNDARHIKQDGPISPACRCLCCSRYSVGYLHHLFKVGDSLYFRLATIHNLSFMADWMAGLAPAGAAADAGA